MDQNSYGSNSNYNMNGSYSQNGNSQANDTGYNPYRQPNYGQGYNPYEDRTTSSYTSQYGTKSSYMGGNGSNEKQKNTHKSGFGTKLVKAAAIALVFGLVGGGVFTGVSYAGLTAIGAIGDRSQNGSSKEASVETSATASASNTNKNTLNSTATGVAADLVDVSSVAEEVMPSVVAITNVGTYTYQGFWGQTQQYESQSCGSGIIVSQDEEYIYIATNNHVVSGADSLTVQFVDEATVSAEVQGTDPSDDLAVVKVELSSIESDTLSQIKVATLGDSSNLKVGEATIAIGNALGYGQSVTTGVISALNRTVTVSDNSSTVTNTNLIQTDAAINPGNSGGALLNANGEVIGINSAKYSDTSVEGIGYAIPISDAMEVVNDLIENGVVTSGQTAYLGIQGNDVSSDVAAKYGMPLGVYVYSTVAGTGAEAAGLRQGDVITELDKTTITSMEQLKSLLENYNPGDTVTLKVSRLQNQGYEEMEVSVVLTAASSISQ